MDFVKLLESTDLKPASVNLYAIKLKQLHNEFGRNSDNLDYLLDTERIMNYINGLNSTDNKLAVLNSILKVISNDRAVKYYQKIRNDLNKVKFDKYKNNVQNENFVHYQTLLDATPAPDFNKDSLEKVIFDVMLYFSVRYPMRLTLHNIEVVRNKADMNDNKKNYLYVNNNGVSFVMNNFKNIDSMGKQVIKLFDSDAIVARNYLKFLKKNNVESKRFILNYYLKPLEYKVDMYARNLKKHLKKKIGKDITMNTIRQSYSSALIQSDAYQQMTNEAKEQAHARVLHNTFWANAVYNKIEPPKVQTRSSAKPCE